MPVHTPHREYTKFEKQWQRCRDCADGTDAIKGRGEEYLPMLEGHAVHPSAAFQPAAYDGYLKRAMFYPVVGRTVAGLTGLTFGKQPTVGGVPKTFAGDFDDVTLTGSSLGSFAMELCADVLTVGRGGIYIDFPRLDESGRSPEGARPYWVHYHAEDMINWRTRRVSGHQFLSLVVLRERVETFKESDPFTPDETIQYRVLELTESLVYTVTIWTEDPDNRGTFTPGEAITPIRMGAPLSAIPFVFVGTSSIGPHAEHPPLLDLVDVDLSHYRTSADQEHGAHFTALPTPYVTGHQLNDGETLGIGAGTAWVFPDPSARAGMVEFSGAGLSSLAALKEEKRLLMATLGARMLETQKTTAEAAETVRMRHAGEKSSMLVFSQVLGQVLSEAMRWHLFWRGLPEARADVALVTINPEVLETLSADDIRSLVATWQAGLISKKTVYFNMQWGEWTRPDVTFEEEQRDIETESEDTELDVTNPPEPMPDMRTDGQ